MIRRSLGALLLALFPALASPYRTVTVAEAVQGRAGEGYVRVFGRYLATGAYRDLVRGVVADSRYALPVEGQVFDYRPPPGALLVIWGELRRGPEGYRLRFHNARPPGDARGPRPVGEPRPGTVLRAWLRVYGAGGAAGRVVGRSEDGRAFFLPGYTGPFGVRCLVVRVLESDLLEVLGPCPEDRD